MIPGMRCVLFILTVAESESNTNSHKPTCTVLIRQCGVDSKVYAVEVGYSSYITLPPFDFVIISKMENMAVETPNNLILSWF